MFLGSCAKPPGLGPGNGVRLWEIFLFIGLIVEAGLQTVIWPGSRMLDS
jgi:hypothetical protein